MAKCHVSRADKHDISKKYFWELPNFKDMHSSDIDLDIDLNSKNFLYQKNIKNIFLYNSPRKWVTLGYHSRSYGTRKDYL